MSERKLEILQRALEREKAARKEAERILEEKSLELYELNKKLKIVSTNPSNISKEKQEMDTLYSSLADAYVKIDLAGNVLEMNHSAVLLFGYNAQVEELNVVNLIYRDDYLYTVNAFKELLHQGTFTDFVARVYTKNRSYRLVNINANLLYDKHKRPIAAEGIVRDITEESKARELIEEQRAELSTIVNNAPFGIVLTEKGQIIKSNKAFQEMLGYSAREIKDLGARTLVSEASMEMVMQLQKEMDEGLKTHAVFVQSLKKKDGTLIKVRVNITSITDEKKKPKYRLSILEDITEESRRKELIEEQQEQLEIIVENSPLGIALSDVGALTKVNHAFCSSLGFTEQELKSMSFKDVTLKEDMQESSVYLEKMNTGELDQFTIRKRYVRKDGSLLYAKTSVSAVRDGKGNIKYQVVILEDISEQEKIERQKEDLLARLGKSNQELQEYAHVVSHDLKSPLRSISALVSWIREDCHEMLEQKGSENLDLIEGTVEKMENLINGILTYSGIERSENEEKSVSIDEVVKTILGLLYIPHHISITIVKPLPRIHADPIRMQQLFQNLIGNAIKYNDKEKGEIVINYESKGAYWLFSIQDNGMGISEKYHEKIFGIFQSLDTNHKNGSTGIGLSIVKKIAEQYGGKVYLTSKEGAGTTFYVKLKKEKH